MKIFQMSQLILLFHTGQNAHATTAVNFILAKSMRRIRKNLLLRRMKLKLNKRRVLSRRDRAMMLLMMIMQMMQMQMMILMELLIKKVMTMEEAMAAP